MAVTEYGGTLVICLSGDAKPEKDDGWFLKESDTGNQFIRAGGAWVGISNGFGQALEVWFPVWAEENAALGANNYEWAFGNGANTPSDGGITMFVPSGWTCTLEAMSLRLGGGTATVTAVLNETPLGVAAQVAVSSGQGNTNTFTPVAIANGDLINFRTLAANGTSSPCVVTAWFKMVK